jgi:hypothetical protein
LERVFFTNTNTGTIVGQGGTILRTTDGGTNWVAQTSGITSSLFGVSFADANTATAVGQDGVVLRTTDGGTTWEPQTSGTPQWLLSVSFTDANTGGAVGTGGANFRTTDGGTTWILQTGGTAVLYDVSFTDANTGTVVGENGTILRMSNPTGIEDNTIDIPANFVLMQNYPNPFNPSTIIQYAIPTASNVKIEIFNITGESVAALVDGFRSEGFYEVNFNATALPSGMYLYRISAGVFVQTKKMILMK